MPALVRQRCWTHSLREAAARCPSCQRFFCRECVTEHEGRVVCAACLRDELAAAAAQRSTRRLPWQFLHGLRHAVQFTGAVALTWLFFHLVGQKLLSLPEKFHEGTLWDAMEKLKADTP